MRGRILTLVCSFIGKTPSPKSLRGKNAELVENVQLGILEGMKFMMLNPQEAIERHVKAHPELARGKNGKLCVELGVGMASAIMVAQESIKNGLGYTDLAKIDEQAKLVKQYASAPNDRDPPRAETFCSNDSAGKVTLTASEWDQVRANTRKYAALLGNG